MDSEISFMRPPQGAHSRLDHSTRSNSREDKNPAERHRPVKSIYGHGDRLKFPSSGSCRGQPLKPPRSAQGQNRTVDSRSASSRRPGSQNSICSGDRSYSSLKSRLVHNQ